MLEKGFFQYERTPRSMVAPEIVDHGFKMALADISVTEGSGWRPSQEGVVKKFVNEFPFKYGTGIHRVPRVLVKEKRKGSSTDAGVKPCLEEDAVGKALLDDGKSTIQALNTLLAKFNEGKLQESACCSSLREVLRTSTIAVQLVFYETSDVLERVAHNAQAHDEENNDYLATTLAQKIKLVMQVKQTVMGGDWAKVEQWFLERFGQGKRTSVRRLILGARCLSQPFLDFIEERALRLGPDHGMPPSYFLQNEFFCGVDVKKAAQRLDQDEQLQAARVLAAVLDNGRPMTQIYFVEKVRPPSVFLKCLSTIAGQYPSSCSRKRPSTIAGQYPSSCSPKRLSTIAGHRLARPLSLLPCTTTDPCIPLRCAAPSNSSPCGRGS